MNYKFYTSIKTFILVIAITFLFVPALKSQTPTLVWADEFDYTEHPDSTKWGYDVGGHGWGNQELQYYTDNRLENSRIENGSLIIEGRKENWTDGVNTTDYTSARLVTRNQGDWLYGRGEVKAKLKLTVAKQSDLYEF